MSIVRAIGWSNSRQSWEERLSGLGLVAGAVSLLIWGRGLHSLQQVILWGLLVLLAALLLRRGWLKLFGPVLFYDMVRLARRGRYLLLRTGFALLLLGFMLITWLSTWNEMDWRHGQDAAFRANAAMGETFFGQFTLIQFIAICLLTPAYVAGSIADEKSRKTLEFMLATDLRNREIVLSKFVSRIANLSLFLLTGLPILSLLQFVGGIDPDLMLSVFLVSFMTMLGLASFSMFCSVVFKKPRDAIACSYLGFVTYIALGLVLFALQFQGSSNGWTFLDYSYRPEGTWVPSWLSLPSVNDFINWFNGGNLVVNFISVMNAASLAQGMGAVLGQVLVRYTIFHLVLCLLCLSWAVARLRAIALKQFHEVPSRAFAKARARPNIGNFPILWKEIHVEERARRSLVWRILIAILVLLSLVIMVWGIAVMFAYGQHRQSYYAQEVNALVTGVATTVGCLALLGVAVRASTAISNERDKNTLDFLLTTTLDSDSILWGKFFGCLLSLRRALWWLAAIWGLGILAGGFSIVDVLLVLVPLLVYASAFTIIGLWFSLVSKSSMRATVWTIGSVITLSVGHWLLTGCCLAVTRGQGANSEYPMMFQAGLTPPFVLGFFHVAGTAMRQDHIPHDFTELFVFSIIGMTLYVLACFLFWNAGLSPRFRQMTHREEYHFRDDAPYDTDNFSENEGGEEQIGYGSGQPASDIDTDAISTRPLGEPITGLHGTEIQPEKQPLPGTPPDVAAPRPETNDDAQAR